MGTNFYWFIGRNPNISVPEAGIHVGKRSAGWSFGFQAYREGWKIPAHTLDLGYDSLGNKLDIAMPEHIHEPSPFESLIESRADWFQKVFRAPGKLVSEYGTEEDPMEICGAPGPDAEQIAKENSYQWRGSTPFPTNYEAGPRKGQPQEWRDAENFRFYDGYFC